MTRPYLADQDEYRHRQGKGGAAMKKLLAIGAIGALGILAACGSSDNGVSVGTNGDTGGAASSSPSNSEATDDTTGSDDTISVENLGDVPPECLALLTDFLKTIEPVVQDVDWKTATLADMTALGEQFQAESDSFDSQSAAAGCDKYDITGSDDKTFQQMITLAQEVAPGTADFLNFIYEMGQTTGNTTPAATGTCAESIAAIEPYLASGKTMQELTLEELTTVGTLMTAVSTQCTAEEAAAFYERADLQAFLASS
jgi:hypothetical protein